MPQIKSVCVYCGSSDKVRDEYKTFASNLGHMLGENNIDLVYGGGHVGLMGITADGVLEAGGEVTGIIPHFLDRMEVGHEGLTKLIRTETMHERKQKMAELSDGFVILPGGLGTLDELFEILTWRQLGLHDKPIIIVNIGGYWDKLVELIDHMTSEHFMRPENLKLFNVITSLDQVIPAMEKQTSGRVSLQDKWL